MYQLNVATEATYLYIPVTVADEIAAAEREAAIDRQIAFDDARDELVGLIKTHPMIMCVEAVEYAVIELLKASVSVGADGIEEVLDIFRSEFNAGWQMMNCGVAKMTVKAMPLYPEMKLRGFQHADAEVNESGVMATDADVIGNVMRPLPVSITTESGKEMTWATDWIVSEDDEGFEVYRWPM